MSDQGSKAAIEDVYEERNEAVAVLMVLAQRLGYPVYAHVGDDPDWPVVYVELPHGGQVSWHIPVKALIRYFPLVTFRASNPWDGHDSAEKRARLHAECRARRSE